MDDKSARVEGPDPPGPAGQLGGTPAPSAAPSPALSTHVTTPVTTPAIPGAAAQTGAPDPGESPVNSRSSFPPTVRRKIALSLEETRPLWDMFRAGGSVRCPSDAGSLALSVDGSSAYRLVCTQCGTASSWFEAAPAGLRDRATPPPADDDPTDD